MLKNYLIIAVLALIMVGAVVYGLSQSGSPSEIRGKKFDQTRISDLNNIKYSIDNYYSTYHQLPTTLGSITAGKSYDYSSLSSDPETSQPYGYKTTGDLTYQLCAVFSQKSDDKDTGRLILPPLSSNIIALHPQGQYCFDLTVTTYPAYNPNTTITYPPASQSANPNTIPLD